MSAAWPRVPLGKVVVERREVPDPESLARGDIRIVSKIRFDTGRIELRQEVGTKTGMILVRPGDLLLSGINAAKGAIAIYESENAEAVAATIHYGAYSVVQERADVNYLWWYLRSRPFRKILFEALPEGIKTELKASRLLPIEIPLPPLAEQQRIVARIEELAAQVHQALGLRNRSVEEAEMLFEQARARTFERAAKGGTQPLSEITRLERGKFSHRPRNDPRFFGGDHPWIQIAEIESSNKYIRNWNATLNEDGLAISKKFPKGTILISIAATIGAVGILDFDCCVPDSIVGVTPTSEAESAFIYHYLGYVRTHLESVAPQSAQKNINLQILSPLPVPKLPLPEQRRVAAKLDAMQARIDELMRLQAETTAELDALLPSILDRAFKGEL